MKPEEIKQAEEYVVRELIRLNDDLKFFENIDSINQILRMTRIYETCLIALKQIKPWEKENE